MPKLRERLAGQFNSASSTAVSTRVSTDAADRLTIDAGGRLTWGGGSTSGDVTLYRDAADTLRTDDSFVASSVTTGVSMVAGVSATTSATTAGQLLDSTAGLAVKYIVRADDGSNADLVEILALVNGSSVSHTEYARITTGQDLATYNVTYATGMIQLRCTPASATTTTFSISKQVILTA